MQLRFTDPGFDYMIASILDFQQEDTAPFWSEPLYYFYPQLDKTYALSLPMPQRRAYLSQVMENIYESQREVLQEKLRLYTLHWQQYRDQIIAALSDAFQTDCDSILNDMVCRISLNPIEPRFPREHTFDIFWKNSERGAIGEALHEIIHLVWFQVWRDTFHDSWDEYEAPSLKWILSEMVVEPIMSDPRLSSINPYYPRENGGCIYPYFFDMRVEGELVMDTLAQMYKQKNVRDFMITSYAYCQKYEQQIRDHIARAEKRT